jgi:hypothetical protein
MNRTQGDSRGVKKLGGYKAINNQSTEMVISVYSFMKKEADSGKVINVNQIQNCVYEATGVSLSSLKCILKV